MPEFTLPVSAIKGRGAATRLAHRFASDVREAFDDGWQSLDETADRSGAAVPTQVILEDVKSVITRNDSPDIHFDLSINPYRVSVLPWHLERQAEVLKDCVHLKNRWTRWNKRNLLLVEATARSSRRR